MNINNEIKSIAEHIATLANKVLKLEEKEYENSEEFSKNSQYKDAVHRILKANLELMAECAKHADNMERILQTMEDQRHEYAVDMLKERLGLKEWSIVKQNPERSCFIPSRIW